MRRTAPPSLASQLILLLLLTVLAAQVPACLLFALQSTKVGRVAFTLRIGDRVAALVHVLGVVPPDSVASVVAAYNIPASRFSIDPAARVALGSMDDDDAEIAHALAKRLRFDPERVRIALIDNARMIVRYLPWRATQKILLVSVRLADDRWLNRQSKVLLPDAPYWLQIGLVQLGAAIIAILLTLGLGLRHIIRPVTVLADAAERAGRGTAVAPLPERGPREFRTMTASFNAMQARLRAFVDDRTRLGRGGHRGARRDEPGRGSSIQGDTTMSVSAEIADAAPQTERSPNECLDMIGGRLELVARMGDQDNDTVLFRTRMPPGQVVPLHGHADPECFYVLAGRLEIFLLDEAPQWRVLPAGRSVLVANGIRHAIRDPASESADLVVATNNRLAQFFRECGRPAQPGKDFMPAGPEDIGASSGPRKPTATG